MVSLTPQTHGTSNIFEKCKIRIYLTNNTLPQYTIDKPFRGQKSSTNNIVISSVCCYWLLCFLSLIIYSYYIHHIRAQ